MRRLTAVLTLIAYLGAIPGPAAARQVARVAAPAAPSRVAPARMSLSAARPAALARASAALPRVQRLPDAARFVPPEGEYDDLPLAAFPAQWVLGEIQRDGRPASVFASLRSLFTGEGRRGGAAVAGHADLSAPGLALPSVDSFEETAKDPARSDAERLKAIAAVAKAEPALAKAALVRIADAHPQGGAREYEIHRAALRALKKLGELRSLRPVTRAHADELLAQAAAEKPRAAFFDYDDTLEKHLEPISAEQAEAAQAAERAGVDPFILTDRPNVKSEGASQDDSVEGSLAPASPGQKQAFAVFSNRGTRLSVFDRKGGLVMLEELEISWTAQEKKAIQEAAALLKERFGTYVYNGQVENLTHNVYAYFIDPAAPETKIQEAAFFLKTELLRRGVDYSIKGRKARSAENPGYVILSKNDKSVGVGVVRSHYRALKILRGLIGWGLPRSWIPKAWTILKKLKLPGAALSARQIAVAGDQFFGSHDADAGMAKGAPGARVFAVGGTADPDLDAAYVWPTQGKAATNEILKAFARADSGGMNKRGLAGLFLLRALSIGSFFLTVLAFPAVAVPAIGWAGYGAVMALGPLAAILAGPLNGALADKLSPKAAMMLNTALRVALSLLLPAFAWFGVVSFGTLLLSSIAMGWLMSSTMVAEGAFVKQLAGEKNIGKVNALLWLQFLAIQVVMALLVGAGAYVDAWNPLVPYYISAAVHALMLPITALMMPGASVKGFIRGARAALPRVLAAALLIGAGLAAYAALPSALFVSGLPVAGLVLARTPAAKRAGAVLKSFLAKIPGFLSRNWIDLALVGGGIAAYAWLWASPLAIAVPFVLTVLRNQHFKTLWKDKGLRNATLFMSVAAALIYPLQYFALPKMAELLAGQAGKGLLLGQFLGAFYFGNMISTAVQAKLGDIKLPLYGPVPAKSFVQAGVLAMAAAWFFLRLFPGSWLAAGLAAAGGAGLMWLASKLDAHHWLKFTVGGFATLIFPYLVWTMPFLAFIPVQLAIFASLLAVGMFFGPGSVILNSYFQGRAKGENRGAVIGVEGSLFNAAISAGFIALALAASFFTPVFPGVLLPMAAAFILGGLSYLFAPKSLPDLPKDR